MQRYTNNPLSWKDFIKDLAKTYCTQQQSSVQRYKNGGNLNLNSNLTQAMLKQFLYYIITMSLLLSACSYTQKVRDGRTAFERKQYAVAVPMLKKEYSKSKSKVEKGKIAFLIGESLRYNNKAAESLQWYKSAYDYQYGMDALKEYAYGLKKTGQYEEAGRAFKNLGIELGSPYEYRREVKACKAAAQWQKKEAQNAYKVFSAAFNSNASDYSPTYYTDNQLIITSDRSSSTGDDAYNWTGKNYSDLFTVNLDNNVIAPLTAPINTEDNEGTVAFNEDYTEMYFSRCYNPAKADAYCKLMMSEKDGDAWSAPVVLDFVEEGVNYGHPSISADGNLLYFSSNHPDGWGGYDIYYSERIPEGWSHPKILNRNINTIYNEKFPVLHDDTLYFSSDGHTGMGGLDIFKVYKIGERWSKPINLKAPVNSPADDFSFIIEPNNTRQEDVLQRGYFTSARENGSGGDDIYRWEKHKIPPPPPEEVVPEIEYTITLHVFVLEKIYEDPQNPNSRVLGRKPIPKAQLQITTGENRNTVTISEEGEYTIQPQEESNYSFLALNSGYLNNSTTFSTMGIGKDPANPNLVFEVEIVLDKIFTDKEITLENIYYDFDQSYIRKDAEPTLNELASILQQNPGIEIELGSHTDCRGPNKYNQNLSQARAQSAVDYLISKGIDPRRLSARGYGENSPAADCACTRCSEEEHQANRRTTFKIK